MNGIDFNISLKPGKLIGNNNFIIQAFDFGYTYIHSRIEGNLFPYSKFAQENLKNQVNIGLMIKYHKNINQTVNFRYVNRVNMEEYTVVDSRLGWYSQKISIYIDLTNIFNIEYTEANFVTLPGRWIKAGALLKFSMN